MAEISVDIRTHVYKVVEVAEPDFLLILLSTIAHLLSSKSS